jgi:outer membrane receptor protein involved in Fe transport
VNALRKILATMTVALLALSGVVYAGNTGKIVGKVTDKSTGEALFGVNILVVGTQRGATTDLDGKFSIIGVPIGAYTLRASQVGYGQVEAANVKVGADETTSQNFQLTSSEVEVKGVTITADAQLVNSQVTSGTQTVSQEAIAAIPNVKSVDDVIKLQAGVVKQGKNLYVRGGRPNEVQYLIDGISSNGILGSSSSSGDANAGLAAVYSGSGSVGGGTLGVSSNAIQSVSVQTSGFDADYGDAQSGIVNIVTKSGSEKYSGSAQYRTDRLASTNFNESYGAFSFGGPDPITKYLLPQMGVQIPGNLTFFFSADMDRGDSYVQFDHNEFYNPIERRIRVNGFLGGIMDGLGFRYRDNQENSFKFNSKLRYELAGSDQVTFGYRADLSSRHPYSVAYRYRADSSGVGAKLSIQNNLGWTHFFSGGKSFIKLFLAKLEVRDGSDVAGLSPTDYSSAYQNVDINGDGIIDLSTAQGWSNARSSVYTLRFDFNGQVHELHMLKTGFEFNAEEVNRTNIGNPTAPLQVNGVLLYPPFPPSVPGKDRGDYPGYGLSRSNINNYPNRGALYVQDNIEFSGLNLHVGIRYDYFDIGKQVFYDDWITAWKTVTNPKNDPVAPIQAEWAEREKGDTVTGAPGEFKRLHNGSSFLYYFTHGNFSPRLSIGYPVTDRIVFYFNYGQFLQLPQREAYFNDPFAAALTGNGDIGNPDLKPQRTVMYEAGFEDQFSDDMSFKLAAFYKDIFDYTASVPITSTTSMVRNLDYASARGFEVILNQALSGNFSMTANYSYLLAKGRSSDANASILQTTYQLPREVRLDWDKNHTLNVFSRYQVGAEEEGKFFGLPFVNNYGISLSWLLSSGSPYTPYTVGIQGDIANQYKQNSGTKPYTSTVNLSIYKGFSLTKEINILATLDINNLLDRRNVNSVRANTGEAGMFGDIDPATGQIIPWSKAEAVNIGGSAILDPYRFDSPRQILLGLRVNWN